MNSTIYVDPSTKWEGTLPDRDGGFQELLAWARERKLQILFGGSSGSYWIDVGGWARFPIADDDTLTPNALDLKACLILSYADLVETIYGPSKGRRISRWPR
jgi:hypothetical protein